MVNKLFVEIASMPAFDEEYLSRAKDMFEEYKAKNVLINCSFDDDKWTITDEYSITGLNFQFVEFSYKRNYEELFGMSFEEFVNHVKCFATGMLSKYSTSSIRDFLNDIRKIIKTNPEELLTDGTSILNLFSPSQCLRFFQLAVCEDEYDFIEQFENLIGRQNKSNQRSLAAIETYFLFDEILRDFWEMDLDTETRLFYYPLYLWWTITAVLPVRPREFLVTARDCLKKDSDYYWLTLRKNQLKGHRKRGIKYKIKEDYKDMPLRISVELGQEIQRYIDLTEKYNATEIDSLFLTQPHYDKWNRLPHTKSRFYTKQNLCTCLNYFYEEVISDIYKLKVVEKTDHLRPGEICRINLGDTRHIALLNLMLEGGTPELAMLLAGHEDIEMAAHYYSHPENLLMARTYKYYHQVQSGRVIYDVAKVSFTPPATKTVLDDGNYCVSSELASGSIDDCLKSVGPNGEIAFCPKCRYYRLSNDGNKPMDEWYQQRNKENSEALVKAIELARKNKGQEETLGEAWNRLKASSLSYEEYLKSKGV